MIFESNDFYKNDSVQNTYKLCCLKDFSFLLGDPNVQDGRNFVAQIKKYLWNFVDRALELEAIKLLSLLTLEGDAVATLTLISMTVEINVTVKRSAVSLKYTYHAKSNVIYKQILNKSTRRIFCLCF